ncbi:hypothetical protein FHR70_002523 [Microvirga lupini]|uniref:Uncharacterized protein n=1 Tax=Microvirga lupini TaxID=420324 RepID=A0A7W4VLM3_9HYPH|nr:hypothetical protein [Microvirga lupini]MBB3019458.1 hypothetical protein [Microvirga lupini]
MAWIVGTGVALFLFFSFPRQMFALLGILVVGGGALFFFMDQAGRRRAEARERELAQVVLRASGNRTACADPRYPVMVEVTNRSPDRTLSSVSFSLSAYKPGYSSSVMNAYSLTSDRILGPGETHVGCWSISEYQGPPEGYTYESLKWEVSKNYVNWR